MEISDKLSIYLAEYDKLKQEQIQRISVRDNLIYVMLTVFGAIFAYALSNSNHLHALLVVPWVSLSLGWVYLSNDKKVSDIKIYIRDILSEKIKNVDINKHPASFEWENQSNKEPTRKIKKYFQLFIDLTIFCFSGIVSLSLYIMKTALISNTPFIIIILGYFSMLLLASWFIVYSE